MSSEPLEIPAVESAENAEADICFCEPHSTRYGAKVYLDAPFGARGDIKKLDWSGTHRRWVPAHRFWEVDFDSLAYCIHHFRNNDYSVAVTRSCIEELAES